MHGLDHVATGSRPGRRLRRRPVSAQGMPRCASTEHGQLRRASRSGTRGYSAMRTRPSVGPKSASKASPGLRPGARRPSRARRSPEQRPQRKASRSGPRPLDHAGEAAIGSSWPSKPEPCPRGPGPRSGPACAGSRDSSRPRCASRPSRRAPRSPRARRNAGAPPAPGAWRRYREFAACAAATRLDAHGAGEAFDAALPHPPRGEALGSRRRAVGEVEPAG